MKGRDILGSQIELPVLTQRGWNGKRVEGKVEVLRTSKFFESLNKNTRDRETDLLSYRADDVRCLKSECSTAGTGCGLKDSHT